MSTRDQPSDAQRRELDGDGWDASSHHGDGRSSAAVDLQVHSQDEALFASIGAQTA